MDTFTDGIKRATLVVVIGATIGAVEFCTTSILAEMIVGKFGLIQELVDDDQSQWKALLVILPVATLIAAVVVYLAPISAGSSLPEIKGFLNGAHVPGLFGIITTFVKTFGVIGVIGCGFPVGREGPMVQLGCALANIILRIPVFGNMVKVQHDPKKRKDQEAVEEMHERALIVTIGGAAGIAAAFRSPIGGVMYMMEDMASYWQHETTVRAFGCTMVATLIFSICLNASHGINYHALVIFDDDPVHTDWKVADIPFFAILALICGLLSVGYSELLFYFQRIRKHRKRWTSPKFKVLEVFLSACLICSVPLYIASGFPCVHLPEDTNSCDPSNCNVCNGCCKPYLTLDQNSCDACIHETCDTHDGGSNGDGHDSMSVVRFDCNEHYYNEMATLWLMGEEGAIKQLYSRQGLTSTLFSQKTLIVFLPIYMFLSGLCGGLSIPFGTFVPNLFIGAAFGRLYALFVQDTMGVKGLSAYGTYSLIGAASVLGGYTRMTVTVAVMIAEASGDASIMVPLMLAVMLARWIANFFSECYDEKMMELRHIPFLHDACSDDKAHDTADTVMQKAITIKSQESVSNLKKLLETRNAHYTAFPVVDDNSALLGLVPGLVLEKTLKEAGFGGDDTEADLVIPMNTIMDPSPYTVRDNFPLSRVFPLIKKLHIEHLVVTNLTGLPVGIIPRTVLVAADGGHVSTLHNKVMNKLDYNKSAMKMRRATVKTKSTEVQYETGELYDDEIMAKRNIRKLSSWLYKPQESFQERGKRNKGTTSDAGFELSTLGEGKQAKI